MAINGAIDTSKIERINEINFRTWKYHILYLLTHEKNMYTLSTSKLEVIDKNNEANRKHEKWGGDNLMVNATFLHCMKDNII
jgi:hypothetical protein